ncbi:MAG: hypothetical protein IKD11_03945, partial [Oscillospiraceae bacterium]|nr:hypothetical protein [Oscillospiraceae bacterium]
GKGNSQKPLVFEPHFLASFLGGSKKEARRRSGETLPFADFCFLFVGTKRDSAPAGAEQLFFAGSTTRKRKNKRDVSRETSRFKKLSLFS